MTVPLHGKHAYIRIKSADGILPETRDDSITPLPPIESEGWTVVAFATDYAFNLEQQNIARAIVMGTDGILDIQSQGLLASANISLILTDTEIEIMRVLGGTADSPGRHGGSRSVNYVTKIQNAIAGIAFDGTIKIDIQIIPVDVFKNFSSESLLGDDASGGDNAHGYVFELQNAVLRSFNTRGSAGQYNVASLVVESGHFIMSNKARQ